MRGLVKNVFGEKGLEVFDSFLSTMVKVINLLGSVGMVFAALGGVGVVTKLMALFQGGSAIATAAGGAGGIGGTATQAAGMGAGATAAVVAGAGLLASGLGEGAAQLNKWGLEREENWKKKAKDKWWTDPRKYFWAAAAGIMTVLNRFFGVIGGLLDIIGAPFRMIIELIRFPFLDEAGKKKQAENLAKFDARIREQFRKGLNAIDFLGLISDDKGSWGSLYGEKGTDGMGYTKDGKTESEQVPGKKGTILLSTPHLEKTKDFLQGKKSGEKVHSIIKISEEVSKTTDPSKVSEKSNKGLTGALIGGVLGSALGPLGAVGGAALGSAIQKRGIKGVIGGAADFVTGGMFDFDKRNRKGAPKDYGIRRIAGGLADYATLGLTDFDKRGAGNFQVNPMFGGKDKAWGSRNEQAKRREKQSGFGLKRGIGGALDFATLGMFDFDKQNRRGAPKGFGIKRIVGGLADFVTGGATDFDKRGTGIGQMNLGEKMSNKKRREAYENNARVKNFRNSKENLQSKFNQLPMETTVNPDGSITSKGSGIFIGGELFRTGQPLTERQYAAVKFGRMASNKKYSDEVLRSYAMYEQQGGSEEPEVIIINKNTTTPIKVGGTELMMIGGGSDGGSSAESYASYQGH